MSDPIWAIRNQRVCIIQHGQALEVSALDIFSAVFSKKHVVAGVVIDAPPIAHLPDLEFSRFPAPGAVRLSSTELGNRAEVGAIADGEFVPLPESVDQLIFNEKWYPIEIQTDKEIRDLLNSTGAAEGRPLSMGALISIRAGKHGPGILVDEIQASRAELTFNESNRLETVTGLVGNLYPYQEVGVSFLRLVAQEGVGCILADEMGLGKTLQIIALLQLEKNAGRGPALVVAPATLLENWRREINSFAPALSVHIHSGSSRPGVPAKLLGFDVAVVSYETCINDEALLCAIPWNVLALDEAQNIKNPSALRTKCVKRLPRRVSIAVTGTPVENRLEDLWSLSDFALPGLLGELPSFQTEYNDDLQDASRLAPIVAPIFLRRKVADVADDLPEKIEIMQPLHMGEVLAQKYETLRLQIQSEYSGTASALVAITKLRSFCAHPQLIEGGEQDPASEMPKYIRLLEILDEVFSNGEKALIFSTYRGIVDLMMKDLAGRFEGAHFNFIDGRVDVPNRQLIVDDFFKFNGPGALLLNPKAAGTGLNITAANHVIHYNPEWNPALTAQASARAYRRKQTRPVTIHHLFFAGTIEEVITDRADFKRQLAGEAVPDQTDERDPLMIAHALQISPIASKTKSSNEN